ncbi:MAG: TetR/AcrR family transcriptional regulator [Raoultibacter sp.]
MASNKNKTLTNDELAKAALAYIDEHGLDSLSFRKLSDLTGVPTMTIVNRFGSKRELMKEALRMMLDENELGAIEGESWQNSIRRVAHVNRNMALRHPKAFTLFVIFPMSESPVLEYTNRVFGTHASHELPKDMPMIFLSLMHSFLTGFQMVETHSAYLSESISEEDLALSLQTKKMFNEETFNRNLDVIICGLQNKYSLPAE